MAQVPTVRDDGPSILRPARQVMRWGVRHGLPRVAMRRGLRHGAESARLMGAPDAVRDPYPLYEQLRAKGPLVSQGLALHTVDHAVASAALRSADVVTVGHLRADGAGPLWWRTAVRAGGAGPLSAARPPSMLSVDGPDHLRYRKLVTRAFSARAVAGLRVRTQQMAHELLDELAAAAARGPVDLVSDYAALLPATVIAEVLGAPVSMRRQFLAWGEQAAAQLDQGIGLRQFRTSEASTVAFHRWMLTHFDRLRHDPGHGLLSSLVSAHDDDGSLSTDELSSIAMLLLAAGFETTVNLIGNGVAALLAHPAQLSALLDRPQGWARAVEEVLRHDAPVQLTARAAVGDVEFAGHPVAAGRMIVLHLGGANRDPAVFAEPARFDVTRDNAAEHIAFSHGPHHCVGAALARMEGEVALRTLFERFPALSLDGTARRRPTRVLRGWAHLPARLT